MRIPSDIIVMAVSAIVGFLSLFLAPGSRAMRIFPFFLLITTIHEQVANVLMDKQINNILLYNIYTVIAIIFYLFLIFTCWSRQAARKWAVIILLGYFVFTLFNLFFYQGLWNFNSISYAVGCLLVVSFAVYYFYELFRLTKVVKLIREPSFWINTALLFNFTCSFPLITSLNFLGEIQYIILSNLQSIIMVMNIFMYSLFTIAFICQIRYRKSTS